MKKMADRTPKEWGPFIKNRAARLARLLELDAPKLIIEQERRLLLQALNGVPVDPESRDRLDREGFEPVMGNVTVN